MVWQLISTWGCCWIRLLMNANPAEWIRYFDMFSFIEINVWCMNWLRFCLWAVPAFDSWETVKQSKTHWLLRFKKERRKKNCSKVVCNFLILRSTQANIWLTISWNHGIPTVDQSGCAMHEVWCMPRQVPIYVRWRAHNTSKQFSAMHVKSSKVM